jgi:hypothetical protein
VVVALDGMHLRLQFVTVPASWTKPMSVSFTSLGRSLSYLFLIMLDQWIGKNRE